MFFETISSPPEGSTICCVLFEFFDLVALVDDRLHRSAFCPPYKKEHTSNAMRPATNICLLSGKFQRVRFKESKGYMTVFERPQVRDAAQNSAIWDAKITLISQLSGNCL
jgi:hypothetical protein